MAEVRASTGRSHSAPTLEHAGGNNTRRKQSALQSFGLRKKSEIEIVLDGDEDFIHSYTTFDEVKGYIKVKFDKDTPVDDLNIFFQGDSNTWVEKMTSMSPRTGRATAKHCFLRTQQPISPITFGESGIARAGMTYTIPFTFVVPDRLLPFICSHKVDDENARHEHTQLPPSIGDQMLAGEGQTLMDDLAPAMSQISYSVRVRLLKGSASSQKDIINESVKVRVIPARAEMAPVSVEPGLNDSMNFQLRKERNVRKGVFRIGKKLGALTAETSQPRSLRIPAVSGPSKVPTTITTSVNLRYDPVTETDAPPQLNSIATKLRVYTFFGASPFKYLPGPNKFDVFSLSQGHYPESVDLSCLNLSSVNWVKHDSTEADFQSTASRRESTTTTKSSTKAGLRRGSTLSNNKTGSQESSTDPILLRRDSACSDASDSSEVSGDTSVSSISSPVSNTSNPFEKSTIIAPSKSYNPALPYYTTTILVPVTLPLHSSSTSISLPSPDLPSSSTLKRKTAITFLPTFHSCLISRTYALELTLSPHGTGAPNITLKTPIQLMTDKALSQLQRQSRPALSAPIELYDPFSLSNVDGDTDGDAEQIANDEAIARALANSPNHPSILPSRSSQPEIIPEYEELQIQSNPPSWSLSASQANTENNDKETMSVPEYATLRHNSLPITPSNNIATNIPAAVVEERPPEYYSGFRRSSTVSNNSSESNSSFGRRLSMGMRSRQSAVTTNGAGEHGVRRSDTGGNTTRSMIGGAFLL